MREVNRARRDKVVGVEEHVVVATRTVVACSIAGKFDFIVVDHLCFSAVDESVIVQVCAAGAVFVVVVPLTEQIGLVIGAVLVVAELDRSRVAGIVVALRVGREEGVRVVLEVQCNEVTGHGRQVDIRDGHGLVPFFAVSVGGGVTGVTEPVSGFTEDSLAAGGFGVDGPVGVAVVGESVALTGGFEGFLTDLAWRTAVDVRGQGREDRGLDVEVHFGVAPVVRGDHDVEGVLGIEGASAEVFDALHGGVVHVERREVAHQFVVEFLLVPCVVGQHRRHAVGGVVHEVRGDRGGVFFTRRERVGRQIDGGL